MVYIAKDENKNVLVHYGTKNMKWGVRRFQNEDGTLTEEGRKRYANMMPTSAQRDYVNEYNKNLNKKIQYLNDNGYKTVDGRHLKGTTISSNRDSERVFNPESNFKWVAEKQTRGIYGPGADEEYKDSYPVFETAEQAQKYASVLDSLPKGSYERAIFETDPNLRRALRNTAVQNETLARYAIPTSAKKAIKNTEIREKNAKNAAKYEGQIPTSARLGMQGKNVIQKVKAGKGSMPTSAITAQQRAKNESIVKSSIPASAWNSKTSYINRGPKAKASGLSTFMKKAINK